MVFKYLRDIVMIPHSLKCDLTLLENPVGCIQCIIFHGYKDCVDSLGC